MKLFDAWPKIKDRETRKEVHNVSRAEKNQDIQDDISAQLAIFMEPKIKNRRPDEKKNQPDSERVSMASWQVL